MRLKLSTIVLLFILIFSCNTDDDREACIDYGLGWVTSVDAPVSGNVNEPIDIAIDFTVFNGCGNFGKFIEIDSGNERRIEIEAIYSGCICTQDIPTRSVRYQFMARTPGTYILKFKSNLTDYITTEIVIN